MDKLKLLYVDDEEVNLSNFKMALKHHFLVITACSAQEALTCFSNQGEIALVVADQKMPGMDGTELLAEIRNRYPDTVRIMLTAYSEPADIMAAINEGEVYHYLTKPWQEEILLDTLNKAAEKYRLTQQNKVLLTQLTEKNEALQRELRTSRFLKDSLIRRDLILSAVNETSQKIISSAHWRHFTEPLIARLGLIMAVSKVHIYCLSPDASGNNRAQQEFEWASEGAVIADHACLPTSFCFAEIHLERWLCLLERGESIIDNTEDFPPQEAAFLQASHIHSLICTPIMVGKRCWGFLSLADCSTMRSWPALEIAAVKTAASLIAEAVHREEMDTELSVKQAQLTQAGRLTAIGEMAKGMAHEINLPMSLISLGADEIHQYCCKTEPNSPCGKTAKEITGQVVKVMRLLEDMRLFSTLAREKISDINLYWTINSALTFFREQFRAYLIQLHEETYEGVPSISTDNQKAEQILVNLLANARYAVMQKAAEVKKFPMQVWVRLYKEELTEEIKRKITTAAQEELTAVLILEVEDNGVGMSEETRQHCTDPFFTTKPRGEGTGLGLSVSKSLVQELGFHLEIESTLGEGSLFRLIIPTYAEYPVLLDNNEIQF